MSSVLTKSNLELVTAETCFPDPVPAKWRDMAMREFDLHGYRLPDVEDFFYKLLSEIRMKKRHEEINFITGTGKIQVLLKKLSKEQELHTYIPMANGGCIVVEFE